VVWYCDFNAFAGRRVGYSLLLFPNHIYTRSSDRRMSADRESSSLQPAGEARASDDDTADPATRNLYPRDCV
jgi:hypothetical protein